MPSSSSATVFADLARRESGQNSKSRSNVVIRRRGLASLANTTKPSVTPVLDFAWQAVGSPSERGRQCPRAEVQVDVAMQHPLAVVGRGTQTDLRDAVRIVEPEGAGIGDPGHRPDAPRAVLVGIGPFRVQLIGAAFDLHLTPSDAGLEVANRVIAGDPAITAKSGRADNRLEVAFEGDIETDVEFVLGQRRSGSRSAA